jgi:hypothetical protein
MVYLLYYLPDVESWSTAKYPWLSKWAGLYRIHPVVIDLAGRNRLSDKPPFNFRSLQDAHDSPHLAGYTWVWLKANGAVYLDEFAHPADNVIYCIGDDQTGFQGLDLPGPSIKLRPTNEQVLDEAEWWAAMVAPQVLYDRFMYLQGKRT